MLSRVDVLPLPLSYPRSNPKGRGFVSAIHRALQGTIPRVLSRTPWGISLSLSFCRSILPLLPCDTSHIMKHLTTWLHIHAIWQYNAYTSWHLPFSHHCDAHCTVWCHDYPILKQMRSFAPRGHGREVAKPMAVPFAQVQGQIAGPQ